MQVRKRNPCAKILDCVCGSPCWSFLLRERAHRGNSWTRRRSIAAPAFSPTDGPFLGPHGKLLALDEDLPLDTLARLVHDCIELKDLIHGRLVHDHVIRRGLQSNTLVGNCLVQLYGHCAHTADVQKTFDSISKPNGYSWSILLKAYTNNEGFDEAWSIFYRMPHRDVVSWNTMIVACTRSGHIEKAIDLFSQMHEDGVRASNITFTCALDACAKLARLECGCLIHAIIVDSCFSADVAVGNALITMYGKCKSPCDARKCFMQMIERDVISWSAVIAAFVQNGLDRHALESFYIMLYEGVQPSNITFVSVLDACVNLAMLREGQKIISCIIESTVDQQETALGNSIVNMFGKCGSVLDAENMFSKMKKRNVITWSAQIGAYTQNGFCEEALALFKQMYLNVVKPDTIAFVCALDACTSLGALEEGELVYTAIIENGFENTLVLANALINMYAKCGHLHHARNLFVRLSQRDVVSWSTMITAYAQNACGEEALGLFHKMQRSGIKPNAVTCMCVLEACTSMGALVLLQGQQVHCAIVEMGFERDATVATALVNLYGKCGRFHDAKSSFGAVLLQNVVSWTSMIGVCACTQHHKEALALFRRMQLNGFKPNNITYVCVLNSCSSLAMLEEGRGVHAAIDDSGPLTDVVITNALINLYGKCGDVPLAVELFFNMPQRDVVSWNALISVFAINGHAQQAMQFYLEMQCQHMEPDEVTFVCILTACSHAGRVEEGAYIFVSMCKDYELVFTVEHYACIIDLLGRAGLLDEAEQLIKGVPFEEVFSAWASLLGACKIHSDKDRGLCVANHLLESYPENASAYVDLSNVYATADLCDLTQKIWKDFELAP